LAPAVLVSCPVLCITCTVGSSSSGILSSPLYHLQCWLQQSWYPIQSSVSPALMAPVVLVSCPVLCITCTVASSSSGILSSPLYHLHWWLQWFWYPVQSSVSPALLAPVVLVSCPVLCWYILQFLCQTSRYRHISGQELHYFISFSLKGQFTLKSVFIWFSKENVHKKEKQHYMVYKVEDPMDNLLEVHFITREPESINRK
jgi:hypothetical protein